MLFSLADLMDLVNAERRGGRNWEIKLRGYVASGSSKTLALMSWYVRIWNDKVSKFIFFDSVGREICWLLHRGFTLQQVDEKRCDGW